MEDMEGMLFQHFKGAHYRVLYVAKHSETQEEMVVYESILDDSVWVRPVSMFTENVIVDGKSVPRFKKII